MDSWKTPDWLKEIFEGWYDPCPLVSEQDDPEINGLLTDWEDKTYVNPPYSNPLPWVMKALNESKKGKRIVMLLKADPSTKVYKELVMAKAHISFFNERLRFGSYKVNSPCTFPSMLVILNREESHS